MLRVLKHFEPYGRVCLLQPAPGQLRLRVSTHPGSHQGRCWLVHGVGQERGGDRVLHGPAGRLQ